MRHKTPIDFYDTLNDHDRATIDRWKDRRSVILCDRMREEMNAKLEEEEIDVSTSTRFARFLVTSFEENHSTSRRTAMLTIWKPSDEQLGEIMEGSAFRITNLHVKPGRFNGLLQLSASGSTPMEMLPCRNDDLPTRCYTSIPRLFAMAESLTGDRPANRCSLEFDTVGVVLRVKSDDGFGWEAILTDESGRLLCVKFGVEDARDLKNQLSQLSESSSQNVQQDCIYACFRCLKLAGLNANLSIVYAKFTDESDFDLRPRNGRVDKLSFWGNGNGTYEVVNLAARLDLGLQPHHCKQFCMIGYTAGFCLLANKQLVLKVDCGGEVLHTLKFPLSLVSAFADSCTDLGELVFLNEEQEVKIEQLKRLGPILRSRRSLYNFRIRNLVEKLRDSPGVEFEVTNVTLVHTRALSALYSTICDDYS